MPEKDKAVPRRRWRKVLIAGIILAGVLVGPLVLWRDGRRILKGLPFVLRSAGTKKDWWAGEGDINLPTPSPLSERIGDEPFHWGVLVHRTADGEACVVLCLTRTPTALPERPSRFFYAEDFMRGPGRGDEAVIQINVVLPWDEFSEPWRKAIDGQWRLERDGAALSVVSIATGQRIPIPLDDGTWGAIFTYHYWKPEDGPEPSRDIFLQ